MASASKSGKKLFSGKTLPQLEIPSLEFPELSRESRTSLRENAESFMREVIDMVDSLREFQKDSAVLSSVYSVLNDAVIRFKENGEITDANHSAEKMFGIEYRSMIGRNIFTLGLSLPEIVERAGGKAFARKLCHANNIEFDASVAVTKVEHLNKDDGVEFIVVIHDVSEVTKMQKALSDSNIKFDALFKALDEASDVIILSDKSNKIIFVNRAFTRHTGYSYEEAVGQNPGFYKSGDLPEKFYTDMWDHLNKREVWQGVLINRSKEGALLYDRTVITPVMNGDPVKPAYYIAVKQLADSKVVNDLQTKLRLES